MTACQLHLEHLHSLAEAARTARDWGHLAQVWGSVVPDVRLYLMSEKGRKLLPVGEGESLWVGRHAGVAEAVAGSGAQRSPEGWWVPFGESDEVYGVLFMPAGYPEVAGPLLAQQALAAWHRLGRRRRRDQLQDQLAQQERFNALAWKVSTSQSLEELLERVPPALAEAVGASHCALVLLQRDQGEGRIMAGWDEEGASWVGLRYDLESPLGLLLLRAFEGNEPVRLTDLEPSGQLMSSLGEFGQIFDLKTTLLLPLSINQEPIALVVLRRPGRWGDRAVLETLGHLIGGALHSMLLHRKTQEIRGYLADLIKSSRDGIISLDLEGRVVLWNQGAEKIFGYRATEITGRHFYLLFSSEQRSQVTENWLEILSGRVISNAEGIGVRASREKFPLSYTLSPIVDQEGQVAGISIIVRDLSETKRLERELVVVKKRLQAIFDGLDDQILLFDPDRRILMANRVAIAYLGQSLDHLSHGIGHPMFPNECPIQRTVETRRGVTILAHPYQDRHFHVQTFPIWSEQGELTGVICHARDITREQRLRQQLITAEKLAMVGELTGFMAHEINNPLSIIAGYAEALKLRLAADDTEFRFAQGIVQNVQRVADVVRNLSRFSNQIKQTDGGKERVLVTEVLEEAVLVVEKQLAAHGISVERRYGAGNLAIWGDGYALQQLILCLLRGACQKRLSDPANHGAVVLATGAGDWQGDPQVLIELIGLPAGLEVPNGLSESLVRENRGNLTIEDGRCRLLLPQHADGEGDLAEPGVVLPA